MLRIAVCDDDKVFLQSIVQQIEKWSKESGIPAEIFSYDNGDELISANSLAHMDIIFLDIIMPLLNGMETAKELRERDAAVRIIFLTVSTDFALESYDVKAHGYFLKPISYSKLKETLDECAHAFDTEPENVLIRTSFGYQKLYFRDIEYVEAQNKRVIFYLKNGSSLEVAKALRSVENDFTSKDGFFKCHRSYIVYMPNVDSFNSVKIITRSGRSIPIARGCSKAFKDAYFALMFRGKGE